MIEMPIQMPTYSPQPALPHAGLSLAPAPQTHAPQTHASIFKAVRVNADAQRISQALTVPEYIETWISIPGAAPGSFTLASSRDNGYCLEHISSQGSALTIQGAYLFCHLRKIRLFWRKTANAFCAESVVDFRLRGDFGSSVIELRHTALDSADEYAWHEALWRRSLNKLALLLGS
jgi:hypothetical protein